MTTVKTATTLEERLNEIPLGKNVTGSELYRYTLEMLGVDTVFAYTGGRVLHILDTLGQSKQIKLLSGPHEQDLGHAAQGYFKVSRKPGILIVTSGPGGTNTATPVKDAHSDSDGLIVTVGQVSPESLDDEEEAFQGAAVTEPFKHWTKWSYCIKDVNEVQSVVKTAYHLATTGRTGPIMLEFPSPIAQFKKAKLKPLEDVPVMHVGNKIPRVYKKVHVATSDLDHVVELLSNAKKPLIYAGGGVHFEGAMRDLEEFAAHADIPYFPTLMLIGATRKEPRNLGLGGMHGHVETNLALYNADVVIILKARLDDRIIGDPEFFAYHAKELLWIEQFNPGISSKIASRVKRIPVDSKTALEYVLKHLPKMDHSEWMEQIESWRIKYAAPEDVQSRVIRRISDLIPKYEVRQPRVSTGVGVHQMKVPQIFDFRPEMGKNMLLTSGGLGTMGTATPYAAGAMIGDPFRNVYIFNGDGCLVMDQRSLSMPSQLRKRGFGGRIKEIVFRDNSLGMVGLWQKKFYNGNETVSELDYPRNYFKGMADQNKMRHFVIEYRGSNGVNNDAVIEEFVKHRHDALLEVRLQAEGVYPMIPSMKSVPEMILPHGMKLDHADIPGYEKVLEKREREAALLHKSYEEMD